MDEVTTGTLKSNTLFQLTEWIWGQEQGWGPIIGIGHTNEGTAATFKFDVVEPTVKAEVRPILEGQELHLGGKKEVCRGRVFVSGQMTRVAVIR